MEAEIISGYSGLSSAFLQKCGKQGGGRRVPLELQWGNKAREKAEGGEMARISADCLINFEIIICHIH